MSRETFGALLQRLYAEQFTGAITIHFGQGQPSQVEIPREPQRIVIDKSDQRRNT